MIKIIVLFNWKSCSTEVETRKVKIPDLFNYSDTQYCDRFL